jgi:hypothetical protein
VVVYETVTGHNVPRVLTYTPSNPVAFRVEMGNVGQHYFAWRYPHLGGWANPGSCLSPFRLLRWDLPGLQP